MNHLGELIIQLSNGNRINVGKVVGKDGVDGQDGQDGQDGAGVEMRVSSSGMLQWKLVGSEAWIDLLVVATPSQQVDVVELEGVFTILGKLDGTSDDKYYVLSTDGVWELDQNVFLYNGAGVYMKNTANLIHEDSYFTENLEKKKVTDVVLTNGKVTSLRLVNDENLATMKSGAANITFADPDISVVFGSTVDELIAKLNFPANSTHKVLSGTAVFTGTFNRATSNYSLVVTSELGVPKTYTISYLGTPDYKVLTKKGGSALEIDAEAKKISVQPNVLVSSVLADLSVKVSVKTGNLDYSYNGSVQIVNSELVAKSANTLFTGDKVIVTAVDGSFETYTVVLTTDAVSVKKVGVVKDVVDDQITVAYGTQVSEFLSALVSVDGRPQTYQLKYNAVNYNAANDPATFINPPAQPWTLDVISGSGMKATYNIVVDPSSATDIKLKAGASPFVTAIDNTAGSRQIDVHYGLTLERMISHIEKADGSPLGSVSIVRPGVSSVLPLSTQLFSGDQIVITAQNGTTSVNYLVMTNAKSNDTTLVLNRAYNEVPGTANAQNFVKSVAPGSIKVPFSTDFAGNLSVQLVNVREALTGSIQPSVLTPLFQKVTFQVLTDGSWSNVTSEYVNINTKAVAPDVEPQYRALVQAQDGIAEAHYNITFDPKADDITFAYDTYSLTPILGTPTQRVIVISDGNSITVNQQIDNANDPIIAQDILDTVRIGHFQSKELQMKAKTVGTWPTNPTTITGFAVLNFTLNDYRLVIKSQDGFANYVVEPNPLLSVTTYGLVAAQTTIVSAANDTIITVKSTAPVTLGEVRNAVVAQNYSTISFEQFNSSTNEWSAALSESFPVAVTGGQPHFRMVITAQDGVKRYVDLVIDSLKSNNTLQPKEDQTVFKLDGSDLIISDKTDRDALLAAIDAAAFSQTVTVHRNTEEVMASNGALFNFFYVKVQAQDPTVDPMIYNIKVVSSNANLAAGSYTVAPVTVTLSVDNTNKVATFTLSGGTVAQRAAFNVTIAAVTSNLLTNASQTYEFETNEGLGKTGLNLFTDDVIEVTAQDGSVQAYRVVIVR
jgi:hypothetical protein